MCVLLNSLSILFVSFGLYSLYEKSNKLDFDISNLKVENDILNRKYNDLYYDFKHYKLSHERKNKK